LKFAEEDKVREAQKGCGSREGASALHARIDTLGSRWLHWVTDAATKLVRGASSRRNACAESPRARNLKEASGGRCG
jgi:hypothetical protein